MKRASILALFIITLSATSFLFPVAAQSGPGAGIAEYVTIEDTDLQSGDIVVVEDKRYRRSTKPYDFKMVGVHVGTPAVGVNYNERSTTKAIISTGIGRVRVNGENGPVKKGDFVTSSSTPGVGMRAADRGYVLGTALEDFAPANPADERPLSVALNVSYINNPAAGSAIGKATTNLRDILTLSSVAVYESPSVVFKYLVAAIVMIIAFLLGFFTFTRVATNSITAIGRNPMAGRLINLAILMNVGLTVAVIAGGVAVAYLIIKI
jgi:hypothetical protein